MDLSTLPPTRMVPSESVYGLNCLNFPFVKESLKLFWPSLVQWSSAYRNSWGERGPSLGCIFSSRRILLQILWPRFQITLFAINRMFGFNSRYTRKLDDILLFFSSVSLTTDPSSGHSFSDRRRDAGPRFQIAVNLWTETPHIVCNIHFSRNVSPLAGIGVGLNFSNSNWPEWLEFSCFAADARENYFALQEQDDFFKLKSWLFLIVLLLLRKAVLHKEHLSINALRHLALYTGSALSPTLLPTLQPRKHSRMGYERLCSPSNSYLLYFCSLVLFSTIASKSAQTTSGTFICFLKNLWS